MTTTSRRTAKLYKAFGLVAATFALACAGTVAPPAKHHVSFTYAGRVPSAHVALR